MTFDDRDKDHLFFLLESILKIQLMDGKKTFWSKKEFKEFDWIEERVYGD